MKKSRLLIFLIFISIPIYSQVVIRNDSEEIFSLQRELRELEQLYHNNYSIFEERFLNFLTYEESFNLDFERYLSYMVINQASSNDGQLHLISYQLNANTTFKNYRNILQYRNSQGIIKVTTLDTLDENELLFATSINYRYIDKINNQKKRKLYILSGHSAGGTSENSKSRIAGFWSIEIKNNELINLDTFLANNYEPTFNLTVYYFESESYRNHIAFDRLNQSIILDYCDDRYRFNYTNNPIDEFIIRHEYIFDDQRTIFDLHPF